MFDTFIIKLILSFITGFVWITFVTIFAEKFGTKLGGAIAGIPSTMLVALLFIGITQSPIIAAQSTTLVPIVVGINALFTIVYIFLARRMSLFWSLVASLVFWSFASYALVVSGLKSFLWSVLGYVAFVIFSYWVLEHKLTIHSHGKKKMQYPIWQIFLRALIGGSLILFAVLATRFGGPLIGGIFASFPALTIAMIIISRMHHKIDYTESLMKNFIIAGTITVVIFVIAVRYSYPEFGLLYGTLVSMLASIIASYLGYKLINKNMK